MKYHIKKNGDVGKCSATVNCPLGGAENHFDSKLEAAIESNKRHEENFDVTGNYQDDLFKRKKASGENYSMLEANERGQYVEELTNFALENGQSSYDQYFNKEYQMWSRERVELHERLLEKAEKSFSKVPNGGKFMISAGMGGAGKTTVLTRNLEVNSDEEHPEYGTVSSDDFKEMLAQEGAIPKIEGLTPMESSTLVHQESSYLADSLLTRMLEKKKNIIYDCTCKNLDSTKRRIGQVVNQGYAVKDIQVVFVDITLDVAKERAKYRYKNGLDNNELGGRYLPTSVIEANGPKGNRYHSKNAETIMELSNDSSLPLPKPLIFDNSGSKPKQINYYDFM